MFLSLLAFQFFMYSGQFHVTWELEACGWSYKICIQDLIVYFVVKNYLLLLVPERAVMISLVP